MIAQTELELFLLSFDNVLTTKQEKKLAEFNRMDRQIRHIENTYYIGRIINNKSVSTA